MIKNTLITCLLVSLSSVTFANDTRTITVSAKASEKAIVDTINWNINLAANDWDNHSCKKKIDTQANNVVKVLTDIYGKNQAIKTSTYSNYVSKKKNYCHQTLSLKTNQLGLYEQTSNALTALGDLNIHISTSSSTLKQTEKKALTKALDFALAKAEVIAKKLNISTGDVVEVRENINDYGYRSSYNLKQMSRAASIDNANISIDPIEIHAEIIYSVEIKQ